MSECEGNVKKLLLSLYLNYLQIIIISGVKEIMMFNA
jgi:hypothetical protein